MQIIWSNINYPEIEMGYEISTIGEIRVKKSKMILPIYHSTNGYDYVRLVISGSQFKTSITKHFAVDDLLAFSFIQIPDNLKNKNVKVLHINGDTRNNNLDNLKWVEDIEEWKVIEDFPNYQVSNHGRIKSNMTGKILSGNAQKYVMYGLRKEYGGSQCTRLGHRLVAQEFVKGYELNFQVNHIDENKLNNYYKNLEWVSVSDNLNFGEHNTKISVSMGSEVRCIETGDVYRSTVYASKITGIESVSIRACCSGSRKTAGGLHWEWVTRDRNSISSYKQFAVEKYGKQVKCVENNKIYKSLSEASRDVCGDRSHIAECCNGKRNKCCGFHWEWVEY